MPTLYLTIQRLAGMQIIKKMKFDCHEQGSIRPLSYSYNRKTKIRTLDKDFVYLLKHISTLV